MLEKIYSELLKDENIKIIYDKIGEYEESIHERAYHNYEHVMNVTDIVSKLLTELNFDKETILKAKIACLFHDTGMINGKEDHEITGYEFTKEYFKKNNISFEGENEVLDAIKGHRNEFNSDSIITLALILGDKLDIKKTRITEDGKKVIGNRQYSHIYDINIKINDNIITFSFITDGNFDISEANEYYFTKKVFNAINSFSTKMNLKPIVLLDNKVWSF